MAFKLFEISASAPSEQALRPPPRAANSLSMWCMIPRDLRKRRTGERGYGSHRLGIFALWPARLLTFRARWAHRAHPALS